MVSLSKVISIIVFESPQFGNCQLSGFKRPDNPLFRGLIYCNVWAIATIGVALERGIAALSGDA